jgi:hypothetical protein
MPAELELWALLKDGSLLAGLFIAVVAFYSGRIVSRSQHDAAVAMLTEHAKQQLADTREERDRWQTLALQLLDTTKHATETATVVVRGQT